MTLKLKFSFLTLFLILLISFLTIFLSVNRINYAMNRSLDNQLSTNWKMVDNMVRTLMLNADPTPLYGVMEKIQEMEEFNKYAIFGRDGTPAFSNSPDADVPNPIVNDPNFKLTINEMEPVKIIDSESENVKFFVPVQLEQSCMECHEKAKGVVAVQYFEISTIENGRTLDFTIRFLIISLLALSILFGFVLLRSIDRVVLRPINKLKKISEGLEKGDLSLSLDIISKDEIGKMAMQFSSFISSFKSIIKNIQKLSHKTDLISNSLASSSDKTVLELNLIGERVYQAKDNIVLLDSEIETAGKDAQSAALDIVEVSKAIVVQNLATEHSKMSIEGILESIATLAKESNEKLLMVSRIKEDVSRGSRGMEEADRSIREVSEASTQMLDLISSVDDIAERTNLLAMNASIEAAHAGTYGKGFAVVAQEIRKLSMNSSDSAKTIKSSLEDIAEKIRITEEATGEASRLFSSFFKDLLSLIDSLLMIEKQSSEISKNSGDINNELDDLMRNSHNVSDLSSSMNQKIDGIARSMENLSGFSKNLVEKINDINQSVEQVHVSANSVAESGKENSQTAQNLESHTSRFKTD